jgi:hypothetical protein
MIRNSLICLILFLVLFIGCAQQKAASVVNYSLHLTQGKPVVIGEIEGKGELDFMVVVKDFEGNVLQETSIHIENEEKGFSLLLDVPCEKIADVEIK